MNSKSRFRFVVLGLVLILSLILQTVVAMPVKAGSATRSIQEPGGEIKKDVELARGVPKLSDKSLKVDAVQDTDKKIPNPNETSELLELKKEATQETPPSRDRGWSVMMNETFEGAFPTGLWSTFDNDGTTNGEYYWNDDDYKPHIGYWSAWPASGGVNWVDPQYSYYANNMDSWMVYGPFDLSNCASADFEFYYWNQSESNFDWFNWVASPNGSNFYGSGVSGDSGGWQYVDMSLASYLGDTSVWLAFTFDSDSSIVDDGPFVDDIALWCYTNTTYKTWTFMVYLDGDNNLESAAINDFMEMSSVGSSASVNIVAQMDRISGYDSSYDNWTDTRRFYITTGLQPYAANGTSIGETNAGDPETLLNFVRWAKAYAPAVHYVLVFWDHGSGWRLRDPSDALTKAVSFDDTSGGDAIDMVELRSTLNTLTNGGASPFDIVGMDACLMGMVEVDNQIKPYANIRVGSEETEPNDGWPYDTILSTLVANPAMSASTLATNIVDYYYSSYGNDNTQSTVDLGATYNTLNTAVNNLAIALINNGANYISEIQAARNVATQFSYTYYIDLWDFADWLRIYVGDPTINNAAVAVENAVTAAVIHEHHGASWPWARGISIYFPKTAGEYDTRYDGSSGFLWFTANTSWDEWIHTYHSFANYPTMLIKTSPANGAAGQYLSTNLSWGTSTGATGYYYCLDTSNNNACNTSWVYTGTATNAVVNLSETTTYYWEVAAVNSYGVVYADHGTWWSLTTGLLPGAFNKTSPSNGATNVSLSPTLTWGASTSATSYEYCYDTTNDNACSSWTSNGTSTSKALSGLIQNTTYYWHVRAVNSIGTRYSNDSATAFWSFTTGGVPPTFNKTGPANGATSQQLSLTLIWNATTNVTSYEYCYDTTNDSACSGWTSNGTSTSKTLSGLNQNTTYYWHVRAVNSFGVTYSNGSDTAFWSFTTGGVPGAFSKTSPANGITNQSTNPTLAWNVSNNATSYEYCYDASNNNSCDGSWINNGANISISLNGLNANAIYYWQVRATNGLGTTYANDNVWWSFTTGNAPGVFNKTNPVNGAVNQPINLNLQWNSSNNAAGYEYCYDMTNNNACDGSWLDNGTNTSVPIVGLNSGTTYYWQVRANNGFGTTYANNNAWWSFTTGNVPGVFYKSAPANGLTNQLTNVTLSWGASSGVISYAYCYDTTNNNACDGTWINNGASTSAPLSGLAASTTYYWHVKAFNPFGETESDGGVWWYFSTGTISIQTSTIFTTGTYDGWILESTEISGVGGTKNTAATTLRLGDDIANKQYRSILSFDTSSLPDNAQIASVTLKFKHAGISGTNPFSTHGSLLVDIFKGSFSNNSALQLSDFKAVANKAKVLIYTNAKVDNWYSKSLQPIDFLYINLTGVTQFRLRFTKDDNNDLGADFLKLISGNALLEEDRPQLIIEYYMP